MVSETETENGLGPDIAVQLRQLRKRIDGHEIRHKACHARLFDAKDQWIETDVLHALLVIKCWRCGDLVPFIMEAFTAPV